MTAGTRQARKLSQQSFIQNRFLVSQQKSGILSSAAMWMRTEVIVFGEISQAQKEKTHMFLSIGETKMSAHRRTNGRQVTSI